MARIASISHVERLIQINYFQVLGPKNNEQPFFPRVNEPHLLTRRKWVGTPHNSRTYMTKSLKQRARVPFVAR